MGISYLPSNKVRRNPPIVLNNVVANAVDDFEMVGDLGVVVVSSPYVEMSLNVGYTPNLIQLITNNASVDYLSIYL